MEVILQLEPEAAHILQTNAPPSPEIAALKQAVARLGVAMQPQHPGERDPALQRYFVIEAKDAETARRIAAQLAELPGVTAAYAKPEAEVP